MRASPGSCICRLAAHPQLAARGQTLRQAALAAPSAPSTSSNLLFPAFTSSLRHASSKAGQATASDRDIDNTAAGVEGAAPASEDPDAAASGVSAASVKARGLEQWLKSEDGQRYKRPTPGRANWIGRTVGCIPALPMMA